MIYRILSLRELPALLECCKKMDITLLILAILLNLAGLAGCIVPGLPGPPLNFIGLLIVQSVLSSFDTSTIIILGILTAVILVIDYLLPVWFAKKFGATRQGIWGSVIGMVIGFFFTPVGMILGLLIGAIVGDLIAGSSTGQATKSGIATFMGTLLSIGLKLGVAGVMTFLVFYESVRYLV